MDQTAPEGTAAPALSLPFDGDALIQSRIDSSSPLPPQSFLSASCQLSGRLSAEGMGREEAGRNPRLLTRAGRGNNESKMSCLAESEGVAY